SSTGDVRPEAISGASWWIGAKGEDGPDIGGSQAYPAISAGITPCRGSAVKRCPSGRSVSVGSEGHARREDDGATEAEMRLTTGVDPVIGDLVRQVDAVQLKVDVVGELIVHRRIELPLRRHIVAVGLVAAVAAIALAGEEHAGTDVERLHHVVVGPDEARMFRRLAEDA